jgi:hypothetical protein
MGIYQRITLVYGQDVPAARQQGAVLQIQSQRPAGNTGDSCGSSVSSIHLMTIPTTKEEK